jgi:hypothetical protein
MARMGSAIYSEPWKNIRHMIASPTKLQLSRLNVVGPIHFARHGLSRVGQPEVSEAVTSQELCGHERCHAAAVQRNTASRIAARTSRDPRSQPNMVELAFAGADIAPS